MTIVYIDRRDIELDYARGQLILRSADGTPKSLPLSQITGLVIRGGVQLNTTLLHQLAQNGASALLLGGRGQPGEAVVSAFTHGDATRRLGQYRAVLDSPTALAVARAVVRTKLTGQRRVLRLALKTRPDQRLALFAADKALTVAARRLHQAVTVEQLRGMEGAAGAAWFEGYQRLFATSLAFTGRNRRPPRDPVNAALSLGYTLAHHDARAALVRAGLDPMLGALHEPSHGRDSAACDLCEAARPYVEQLVWRLFATQTLRGADFEVHNGAVLLKKAGRAAYYEAYEATAPALRKRLARLARLAVRACLVAYQSRPKQART
jgi:CRISPR-associated protein Cas1